MAPLVAALEAEGFTVWWDAHIGGGAHWRRDIEQHLAAAKCVLVAWSKRSVGPDGVFVHDEARRAQRRNAYLPVCLDRVDPPLGFGEIQALPLKGWKGNRADPRFQAVASAVRSRISGEHEARPHVPYRQPRISRRAALGGGAGVAAVAGAGGWFLLKPRPANAKRIAVLPFANLSGHREQDYFVDGIAEELRSALTRIGMQVIGRASSNAVKDLDTPAAAEKLDVANILSGSVRLSSDMIRVSAQLVSGSDGVERWSHSYDRAPGDAIKIQADIAENVARALSIALGKALRVALTLGGTADPVAQDLVHQSRQALVTSQSEADVFRSIALADSAIARDPRYAGAYLAKASAHLTMAQAPIAVDMVPTHLAAADAAARRAIAIAPKWGVAYTVKSESASARLDFASALSTAKRALSLSPDDASVIGVAAMDVAFYENVHAGLGLVDRAIALDPLQTGPYSHKAFLLVFAGQYRAAIDAGRKALSLEPKNGWVRVPIGDAFLLLGQPAEAKSEYDAVGDDAFKATRLALLAVRTGDRAGAERILAQMQRDWGPATSYQHAEILAQLGALDAAFAEFDAAVRRRDSGLRYLKVDPFLDPIRRDPRYEALAKQLNFP